MKKALLLMVLLNASIVFSQNNSLWNKTTSTVVNSVEANKLQLQKATAYTLNFDALKAALLNVTNRESISNDANTILTFPNSEGELEHFRVFEASIFAEELQRRYPNIKSYAGQNINDPSSIIRFSVSPLGFQSMQLSASKAATFIEAISIDQSTYAVFKKEDRIVSDNFECEVTESIHRRLNESGSNMYRNADDAIFRNYKLAVSATGEYTQFNGGTKASALAAINQTMTIVNGIFENDFNVRLTLIGNTDDVIYTNTGSDPYGNTTANYSSELQSTLTSVIGEANYDIGHLVANLQNNGNAGCIGCVCVNNQKGSGWTSYTTPNTVNFAVDYVAHEMGHQFGGNHTWTHGGNEGTNAQMEPGSGSTIMGYAGITGATTDVQSNSDPYFHARTIEQITNYIKSQSCQTDTNTGNNVPVVNAGSNYTIPNGTAFVLDGTATDADPGDVLTYCWEQYDENNAATTLPSTTATSGVAFRSYSPTADSYRYFPNLTTIKSGATSWEWEAVPDVARPLNFRLTVRDNRAGGATNNSDDVLVTVNGTAGPFLLNSPNTNVTWETGTTETVTWDVAGTTANGINAADVDIYLSTDGGDTYPIVVALTVTNDGSQDITVPNNPGTQNRIMVRGSNNIFFDISNTDFTIESTTPNFLISATPDTNESCTPSTADYTIDLTALAGFNSPVVLSTSGMPAGATASFNTNPVTPTGSAILTLDPGTAALGTYTITVTGIGGGITQTVDITYIISSGTLGVINLTSPTDGELDVSASPTFSWTAEPNADTYEIEVALDLAFSNIVFNETGIIGATSSTSGLLFNTDYFWRVRSMNSCVTSNWSAIWNFTTQDVPPCTGTEITTFPYLETFDSGIGDWTQASGTEDDGDWTLDDLGTPSANTGPSDDITVGGNYFYTEASTDGLGSNATVILISPCFNLFGQTSAYFTFYYHMYGTETGSLDLEITSDDGNNWTSLFSDSGNIGNIWNVQNIDLTAYLGQTVKFRFVGITGNGWGSDIAIDQIGVGDPIIPDYCASNGNNTGDEYIDGVQISTISNLNTGPGVTSLGYSDYSQDLSLTTTLYAGTEYTITITPEWPGTVFDEGYAVWVDYNHDGDFLDSGELVWSQAPSQNPSVSGTFTVPYDINYGSESRMRVALKYNGIPTSCESFDYGEVEDYTINLAYDGLLFINNVWVPNAPSDATGSDNALILNNTYSIISDIEVNDLIVQSGSGINVLEGESLSVNGDLTNSGNIVLNSSSTSYSSLMVTGNVTGDVVYKRHVNINASSGQRDLISAPVTGQTFGAFTVPNSNIFSNPGNTTEKLFGPFDKSTGTYLTYDTNIPAEAAIILEPGIGYRAASTDNGNFEFEGTVNTAIVNVPILNTGATFTEWNLIGNPFPAYIKLSNFLSDNIGEFYPTNAAVYGYDGDASNGWKIWNNAYSLANPNAVITPGQGFLVSSKIGGGNVTFDPLIMTIATGNSETDDDFIDDREANRNEISYFKLEMSTDSENYATDFYFTNLASRGLDIGFDATVFNSVAPNYAIYSHLVEENEGRDMSIQSVKYDDLYSDIFIPLGINATQGQQINISIASSTAPEDIDVYLEDNLLNTSTLLTSGNYNFVAESNISGTGRFFIRFESETLSNEDFVASQLSIYSTLNPKEIVFIGTVLENTVATLYDIHGRKIVSQSLELNENIQSMDVASLSAGIYIIKVQSDNSVQSQKLIIR